MREHKTFGKRKEHKSIPNDGVLKDVFGVVNKGCDSEQVIDFIAKTTGHRIKEIKENESC